MNIFQKLKLLKATWDMTKAIIDLQSGMEEAGIPTQWTPDFTTGKYDQVFYLAESHTPDTEQPLLLFNDPEVALGVYDGEKYVVGNRVFHPEYWAPVSCYLEPYIGVQ